MHPGPSHDVLQCLITSILKTISDLNQNCTERRGRGSLNEYIAGNNIQYYRKCSKDESWGFKMSSSHITGTTRYHRKQKAGNTYTVDTTVAV